MGEAALVKNTTASNNSAFGTNALKENTTGGSNTAVGKSALPVHTTGNDNTAIGYQSLYSSTTAANNTAVGESALYAVTTGGENTAIGEAAGNELTTGSNNTLVGRQAGTSASPANMVTGSNTVVLGNNSVTNFNCKVSLTTGSDERDKADITDFTKGLDIVNSLRPVTYKWDNRSDYSNDLSVTPNGTHKKPKLDIGLIAQEVETVVKANGYGSSENDNLLFNKSTDGLYYGLNYERFVPVLINAIKELSAKVTALEAG